MKSLIEHLERMAETLDGVTEDNWIDTPQDIARIYRSVANEIRDKMSAQNQSVTNCNQFKIREALEMCVAEYSSDDEARVAWSKAKSALAEPPRNCDVFSKAEVLEELDDRSFSKEDTIEWLFDEAKGAAK